MESLVKARRRALHRCSTPLLAGMLRESWERVVMPLNSANNAKLATEQMAANRYGSIHTYIHRRIHITYTFKHLHTHIYIQEHLRHHLCMYVYVYV